MCNDSSTFGNSLNHIEDMLIVPYQDHWDIQTRCNKANGTCGESLNVSRTFSLYQDFWDNEAGATKLRTLSEIHSMARGHSRCTSIARILKRIAINTSSNTNWKGRGWDELGYSSHIKDAWILASRLGKRSQGWPDRCLLWRSDWVANFA